MAHTYVQERRIEFADTDMAGIVHFANFFRYMESTEHAFFRSLGFTLHEGKGETMSGWARVGAKCDYRAPLHYGDLVAIELRVREKRSSSLAFDFEFRLIEREGEPVALEAGRAQRKSLASGSLTTVHVTRPRGAERLRAAPIPEAIDRAVEAAPE